MTQGLFIVTDNVDAEQLQRLICQQITELWREFRSVRVYCVDQSQAEQLDEALWQQPTEAFVPHNLSGEGPPHGAPVELCWPNCQAPKRRPAAAVNLQREAIATRGLKKLIDWVPSDEAGRELARQRYKVYRSEGVQLETKQAASINDLSD
ncbi:DNA polymerase III subunit chi [Pseudidiomarina taiwanensis]|uniref:DNA polymerase III subunit chi n=1 Tax=Pseudidiomarina taiwanensis TaxID=337250 RepID=A0A432ZM95_9GAMM|nr:DNA polymerase III subunit chi [Pseudidiomarina taiwanensis]RUO78992.1 DNA polymerase III subunit chi [Pseudidiomarina taiwanensis]